MVGNIAQNQEQINFVIVFSTIICVSMVLLITSVAIFVDHIKVASEQSNPWLMGKCSPGVEWMIYLAWKLQFLEMAAKLWPSFLWIGQMEMVSMSLCWNAKVGRSHWAWDKQLPLVSRICEDAQRSQDRVPSPQNYAAWKSALAL